jgi:hypothetical protein
VPARKQYAGLIWHDTCKETEMTKEQFDLRYEVAMSAGYHWYVRDRIERKIESGPYRTYQTTHDVFTFMRAHCD